MCNGAILEEIKTSADRLKLKWYIFEEVVAVIAGVCIAL